MKCLVCGRNFEGNECDVCGFPVVNFPGENIEESLHKLEPTIADYCDEFMKKADIGVTIYYTSVKNGSVLSEKTEDICFGKLWEVNGNEKQLPRSFDNIPAVGAAGVRIFVQVEDGYKGERTVIMPVPRDEKNVRLGIRICDGFNAVLRAAGDDSWTESEPFFLFE